VRICWPGVGGSIRTTITDGRPAGPRRGKEGADGITRRRGGLRHLARLPPSRPIASRRSLSKARMFFAPATRCSSKMQIVRGCDLKRNALVYMVHSDKLIEGSPKNSTLSIPVMPRGAGDEALEVAEWVE
jgi:CreA protein